MSLSNAFNTVAPNGAPAPDTTAMGREVLALLARRRDGATGNFGINEKVIDLIQRGASLTVRDAEHERNALMWAAVNCRPRVLAEILKHPVDLQAKDKDGMTAMDLAIKGKHKPAMALLDKARLEQRAKLMEELKDMSVHRKSPVFRRPLRLRARPHNGHGGQSS